MMAELKVYISSTSVDLTDYRMAVIAAMRKSGFFPICMEDYVAQDRIPVEKCLADVAASDLYVGIFAWRYGFVPPCYDRSITELEYRKAVEAGIPALLFLLDENAEWPSEFCDTRQDATRISALREEMKLTRMISWFTPDPHQLASVVQSAATLAERKIHRAQRKKLEDLLAERYAEVSVADSPEQKASLDQAIALVQETMRQQSLHAQQTTCEPIPVQLPKLRGTFVDRVIERETLFNCLHRTDKRLVVIVAPGGYGKTELTTKVLKEIAPGSSIVADDVQGILYIRCEMGDVKLGQIFAEAGRIAGKKQDFCDTYASKEITPARKLEYFFCELSKAGNVWLVMDNFEDLLDSADDSIKDEEIRQFLETAVSVEHNIRMIVASRAVPKFKGSRAIEKIDLCAGLPEDKAIEYLREEGREYGLAAEDEEVLRAFVRRVHCIPKALESVVGYLEGHHRGGTTIRDILSNDEIFFDFDRHDLEEGLKGLVFQQFKTLSPDAQLLLSALSVFPRPVTNTALRYLLQGIGSAEIAALLTRLEKNRLISQNNGYYDLHPVVRSFVYSRIPKEPQGSGASSGDGKKEAVPVFSRTGLHLTAAGYYGKIKKSKKDGWVGIEDLDEHLEQIYHLFHSGKYNQACEVLKEIDHQGLNRFGYYNKIVELRSQLIDKIPSKHLSAENMSHLGRAYRALGDSQKAISFFLPALEVAQDSKNLELERSNLGNLGSAYLAMGGANTDTALDYYLKALDVAKKIRKPGPLGTAFADLGDACYQKGEMERALQYFKDALKIALSMPNNDSAIGADYGRIGNVCFALGRLETVEDYYKKAIEISRKANNRRNIGINLGHLARYYYAIGLYTEGLIFAQESLSISKAIGSRRNEAINLTQMAYLHAGLGDFEKAIALNQQSLKVSYDISDQRAEAINLGHMSVAYIAMGKVDDALQCCRKALELTHGDRRGEGINLLFLSRIHVAMGEIDKAIEYSQSAIDSFNDVGDRRYQREARCQMGIAWHASGDFQKSLDYCQKALANASEINDRRTMSLGYLHLGKVWHHSGDWLKAKEFYGESARLDQSATKYIATMGLGIIGLNEDQREDAIEYFSQGSDLCRELLDKTPSLWEPMQYLALCQLAQGKAAEAKATYKRALEICNAKGVVKAALRELDVLYHAEPELKGIEDVRVMLSAIL